MWFLIKTDIPEKKTVDEKDSTAGLMVWEDLKPEEKEDRVPSPKYTAEPGASSELGIEVLDDATGPVEETATIHSAQPVAVRLFFNFHINNSVLFLKQLSRACWSKK